MSDADDVTDERRWASPESANENASSDLEKLPFCVCHTEGNKPENIPTTDSCDDLQLLEKDTNETMETDDRNLPGTLSLENKETISEDIAMEDCL